MPKPKPKRKRTAARRNLDRSKAHERRVARWFGTVRTPLSGGSSRHTRSDTLHPDLYIEVKGAAGPTGTNGWLWRFLRERYASPYVAYPGRQEMPLVLVPNVGVERVPQSMLRACPATRFPAQLVNLWWDTLDKARTEDKTPVVVLVVKGCPGFWIVTTHLDEVKRARAEALRGEA